MNGQGHPSAADLLSAASGQASTNVVHHLSHCPACRVRYSRVRRAQALEPLEGDGLERVLSASQPLPRAIQPLVPNVPDQRAPAVGELWRIGRDEALVVWVRQVFEDGIADVVPIVLDVDLADEDSVLLPMEATALGMSSAALVALRTHVEADAFINRLGHAEIGGAVEEVISAIQEGRRAVGVTVGALIASDDDERIEYRQAMRDLLAELAPHAWPELKESPAATMAGEGSSTRDRSVAQGVHAVMAELDERLPGLRCYDWGGAEVPVDSNRSITPELKAVYLGTAVICTSVDGPVEDGLPDIGLLAEACSRLVLLEPDADAVAVSLPVGHRRAVLLATAHMRTAVGLPQGAWVGPVATVEGLGLVDTLCKYLEEASTNWEITESAGRASLQGVSGIASRHAEQSLSDIRKEGGRAHLEAKKKGFAGLPGDLGSRVADFVQAVVDRRADENALTSLLAEVDDD